MKAAIFEQPGLKNLRIMDNVKKPELTDHNGQGCWCKSYRQFSLFQAHCQN
jgi:hypothetical protein